MVSEVQRERVLSEAVPIGIRDFDDLIQNATESKPVDESFIQCHGRMGYLGDREWRAETYNAVHRKCDYDDAIFSNGAVDIRREDWKQLEEDTMAKREDSIYLFDKHRDVAVIASLGYIPAIRHFLQHSRWGARRVIVLCSDVGKKASVKLNEIVIYWEQ